MKKIGGLLFVCLLAISLSNKTCHAENERGISISPFFQDVTLDEGQNEKSFDVEVKNNTDAPVVFKISVLDFGSLGESGGVAFVGSGGNFSNKYSLASWVVLEKDAILLESGESQPIHITVQNRESLSPGGHYAAIMLKMENDSNNVQDKSSEVALNPTASSLIFVRKLGGEMYGLNLKEQEIERNFLSLPSVVRLRFQNTGNVHVAPRGLVKIIDPMGKEIMRGIINGESAIILPETFRIYPTSLQKTSLAFLPGKYKLVTEYRYDGKEEFTSKQKEFYFVPAVAALVCMAFVGAIATLIAFVFRRKRKK